MQRELRGIGVALLLIAVTTVVLLLLRHYFGVLRGAVLYLVPVMIAGSQLGTLPALVTAIAGVILSARASNSAMPNGLTTCRALRARSSVRAPVR